jgi:hypothetical protein
MPAGCSVNSNISSNNKTNNNRKMREMMKGVTKNGRRGRLFLFAKEESKEN